MRDARLRLEATAPKPGNVHRGADFEDLTYPDLIFSAVAIGPAMEAAATQNLGATILSAVQTTQSAVGTNSNLGTILLLAPLAAVPLAHSLKDGVVTVLQQLDAADACSVYEAIRLARPGGMGTVDAADIAGAPPRIYCPRCASPRSAIWSPGNTPTVFAKCSTWSCRRFARGWIAAGR